MTRKHAFHGDDSENLEWEKQKKDRVIKIGKSVVAVSEEVYKAYYQMARRERYMENDIKIGRIEVNAEGESITFIPSKEDSVERLLDTGEEFSDETKIEDIICDQAMLGILQAAIAELNREEQELIEAIYNKELTVRDVAIQENVSHVAIIKRHKKTLDKLEKYFL